MCSWADIESFGRAVDERVKEIYDMTGVYPDRKEVMETMTEAHKKANVKAITKDGLFKVIHALEYAYDKTIGFEFRTPKLDRATGKQMIDPETGERVFEKTRPGKFTQPLETLWANDPDYTEQFIYEKPKILDDLAIFKDVWKGKEGTDFTSPWLLKPSINGLKVFFSIVEQPHMVDYLKRILPDVDFEKAKNELEKMTDEHIEEKIDNITSSLNPYANMPLWKIPLQFFDEVAESKRATMVDEKAALLSDLLGSSEEELKQVAERVVDNELISAKAYSEAKMLFATDPVTGENIYDEQNEPVKENNFVKTAEANDKEVVLGKDWTKELVENKILTKKEGEAYNNLTAALIENPGHKEIIEKIKELEGKVEIKVDSVINSLLDKTTTSKKTSASIAESAEYGKIANKIKDVSKLRDKLSKEDYAKLKEASTRYEEKQEFEKAKRIKVSAKLNGAIKDMAIYKDSKFKEEQKILQAAYNNIYKIIEEYFPNTFDSSLARDMLKVYADQIHIVTQNEIVNEFGEDYFWENFVYTDTWKKLNADVFERLRHKFKNSKNFVWNHKKFIADFEEEVKGIDEKIKTLEDVFEKNMLDPNNEAFINDLTWAAQGRPASLTFEEFDKTYDYSKDELYISKFDEFTKGADERKKRKAAARKEVEEVEKEMRKIPHTLPMPRLALKGKDQTKLSELEKKLESLWNEIREINAASDLTKIKENVFENFKEKLEAKFSGEQAQYKTLKEKKLDLENKINTLKEQGEDNDIKTFFNDIFKAGEEGSENAMSKLSEFLKDESKEKKSLVKQYHMDAVRQKKIFEEDVNKWNWEKSKKTTQLYNSLSRLFKAKVSREFINDMNDRLIRITEALNYKPSIDKKILENVEKVRPNLRTDNINWEKDTALGPWHLKMRQDNLQDAFDRGILENTKGLRELLEGNEMDFVKKVLGHLGETSTTSGFAGAYSLIDAKLKTERNFSSPIANAIKFVDEFKGLKPTPSVIEQVANVDVREILLNSSIGLASVIGNTDAAERRFADKERTTYSAPAFFQDLNSMVMAVKQYPGVYGKTNSDLLVKTVDYLYDNSTVVADGTGNRWVKKDGSEYSAEELQDIIKGISLNDVSDAITVYNVDHDSAVKEIQSKILDGTIKDVDTVTVAKAIRKISIIHGTESAMEFGKAKIINLMNNINSVKSFLTSPTKDFAVFVKKSLETFSAKKKEMLSTHMIHNNKVLDILADRADSKMKRLSGLKGDERSLALETIAKELMEETDIYQLHFIAEGETTKGTYINKKSFDGTIEDKKHHFLIQPQTKDNQFKLTISFAIRDGSEYSRKTLATIRFVEAEEEFENLSKTIVHKDKETGYAKDIVPNVVLNHENKKLWHDEMFTNIHGAKEWADIEQALSITSGKKHLDLSDLSNINANIDKLSDQYSRSYELLDAFTRGVNKFNNDYLDVLRSAIPNSLRKRVRYIPKGFAAAEGKGEISNNESLKRILGRIKEKGIYGKQINKAIQTYIISPDSYGEMSKWARKERAAQWVINSNKIFNTNEDYTLPLEDRVEIAFKENTFQTVNTEQTEFGIKATFINNKSGDNNRKNFQVSLDIQKGEDDVFTIYTKIGGITNDTPIIIEPTAFDGSYEVAEALYGSLNGVATAKTPEEAATINMLDSANRFNIAEVARKQTYDTIITSNPDITIDDFKEQLIENISEVAAYNKINIDSMTTLFDAIRNVQNIKEPKLLLSIIKNISKTFTGKEFGIHELSYAKRWSTEANPEKVAGLLTKYKSETLAKQMLAENSSDAVMAAHIIEALDFEAPEFFIEKNKKIDDKVEEWKNSISPNMKSYNNTIKDIEVLEKEQKRILLEVRTTTSDKISGDYKEWLDGKQDELDTIENTLRSLNIAKEIYAAGIEEIKAEAEADLEMEYNASQFKKSDLENRISELTADIKKAKNNAEKAGKQKQLAETKQELNNLIKYYGFGMNFDPHSEWVFDNKWIQKVAGPQIDEIELIKHEQKVLTKRLREAERDGEDDVVSGILDERKRMSKQIASIRKEIHIPILLGNEKMHDVFVAKMNIDIIAQKYFKGKVAQEDINEFVKNKSFKDKSKKKELKTLSDEEIEKIRKEYEDEDEKTTAEGIDATLNNLFKPTENEEAIGKEINPEEADRPLYSEATIDSIVNPKVSEIEDAEQSEFTTSNENIPEQEGQGIQRSTKSQSPNRYLTGTYSSIGDQVYDLNNMNPTYDFAVVQETHGRDGANGGLISDVSMLRETDMPYAHHLVNLLRWFRKGMNKVFNYSDAIKEEVNKSNSVAALRDGKVTSGTASLSSNQEVFINANEFFKRSLRQQLGERKATADEKVNSTKVKNKYDPENPDSKVSPCH